MTNQPAASDFRKYPFEFPPNPLLVVSQTLQMQKNLYDMNEPFNSQTSVNFYGINVLPTWCLHHSLNTEARDKKHTEYQQKQIWPQDPVLPVWKVAADGQRTPSYLFIHTNASFQTNVVPAKRAGGDNLCMKMLCFTDDVSLEFDRFVWDAQMKIFCGDFRAFHQATKTRERQTAWYTICGLWHLISRSARRTRAFVHACAHTHALAQRRVGQRLISVCDRGLTSVARR